MKIAVLYDPVVHPWILPEERENTNLKDTCMLMFTAALFTIAKTKKQLKCHNRRVGKEDVVHTHIYVYTHTHIYIYII